MAVHIFYTLVLLLSYIQFLVLITFITLLKSNTHGRCVFFICGKYSIVVNMIFNIYYVQSFTRLIFDQIKNDRLRCTHKRTRHSLFEALTEGIEAVLFQGTIQGRIYFSTKTEPSR